MPVHSARSTAALAPSVRRVVASVVASSRKKHSNESTTTNGSPVMRSGPPLRGFMASLEHAAGHGVDGPQPADSNSTPKISRSEANGTIVAAANSPKPAAVRAGAGTRTRPTTVGVVTGAHPPRVARAFLGLAKGSG